MDRKQFRLTKLKLLENKGIEVQYESEEIKGGENFTSNNKTKIKAVRHHDMEEAADEFIVHIIEIMGLPEKAAEEIEMIGITASGKDDTSGIVISAKMDVLDGRVVTLNTPNILFTDPVYDNRESVKKLTRLQTLYKALENEVYAYLFKDKLAQQSIGFPGQEKDDEKGEAA